MDILPPPHVSWLCVSLFPQQKNGFTWSLQNSNLASLVCKTVLFNSQAQIQLSYDPHSYSILSFVSLMNLPFFKKSFNGVKELSHLSQSSPQGKAGFKLQKMSKRGSKTSSRLHKCPKPLACSMVWFLPTSNVLARRHLPDLPPWWVPRPYSGHRHLCAPQ